MTARKALLAPAPRNYRSLWKRGAAHLFALVRAERALNARLVERLRVANAEVRRLTGGTP